MGWGWVSETLFTPPLFLLKLSHLHKFDSGFFHLEIVQYGYTQNLDIKGQKTNRPVYVPFPKLSKLCILFKYMFTSGPHNLYSAMMISFQ